MIVSNEEQFSEFINRWDIEDLFVDVVYSCVEKHPANNKISAILVQFVSGDSYVLPFNHNDCTNLNIDLIGKMYKSTSVKFCVEKKNILVSGLRFQNLIDLKLRNYINIGEVVDSVKWLTPAHDHYYSKSTSMNINNSIPIMKHIESFNKLVGATFQYRIGNHNPFYNDKVPVVLATVESNGLHVNMDKFVGKRKNVTKESLVHTHYNIYTATGRPSNAFGGVNYAALGKHDGSRVGFDSRFSGGKLYQYDYDAFHLRLIANLINYDLPFESVHTWFAKQYFGEIDITDEVYDESKKISFTKLYSNRIDEDEDIEFFGKVYTFRKKLWAFAETNGYIPSPITARPISLNNINDVSESKLFNYLLQLLETEHNISIMYDVIRYMKNMKSKLTLYTYDSFLFDVHPDELDNMAEIKSLLEESGKYPVKRETGHTYHSIS